MGHFGVTELVIIMVVILLLFGAKRIPEIAGSMGKGIKEFKKQMNDLEAGVTGNDAAPPRLTADELQRPRPTTTTTEEAERPEPRRLL